MLRRLGSAELRARLFREIGEQFRWVGWGCIAVLLTTGALNLHFSRVLDPEVLGSSAFWSSRFGQALAVKLGAGAVMIMLSAIHDFVHGPAASRLAPESPEALAFRRRAARLGRLNAVLGLVVVWAAVVLTRGG